MRTRFHGLASGIVATATAVVVSTAASCTSATPAPAPKPADAAPAANVAAKVDATVRAANTPRVEGDAFALWIEAPDKTPAGKPGTLRLRLEGRSGWHVNQDYPIRVRVRGDEVTEIAQPSLTRTDAIEFGAEYAEFAPEFVAHQGGDRIVHADVSFAMCTDKHCILEKETVTARVAVK